MADDGSPGESDDATGAADEADAADAEFDADRATAAEMLAGDDVAGFFAGVVRGGELDYAFGHRFDDPETVGTQALALAAKHLQAIADEAEVPVERVAEDAAEFASVFDDGE